MEEPKLERAKHIKYWQRCQRTLLPTEYTSTDSSRMTLGFFILSALDLLGAGAETFPAKDRANIRQWLLHCQHPDGGFCGSPNHRYPDQYYADVGDGKQQMDPANLPATFFAILSLSFVGGLGEVRRQQCLDWLASLQREDGSFGEFITQDGVIRGGRDMRYCHIAAAVRWVLKGDGELQGAPNTKDIDVAKLVDHIRSGQTYDGGISESSQHEAHAGYTYCAIAALSFLGRLPKTDEEKDVSLKPALSDVNATIRWLVSRQLSYDEEDEEDDEDEPENTGEQVEPLVPGMSLEDSQFVGFNGRCNKKVDTCYAFWVTASLEMLGSEKAQLVNVPSIRRFLLSQTQHAIGGFGKGPGNPPDIYHSYLGLAALAAMKEPGIKSLDSALCISQEQKETISKYREAALVTTRIYWNRGFCFTVREDDPDFEEKIASNEEPPKSDDIKDAAKELSALKI